MFHVNEEKNVAETTLQDRHEEANVTKETEGKAAPKREESFLPSSFHLPTFSEEPHQMFLRGKRPLCPSGFILNDRDTIGILGALATDTAPAVFPDALGSDVCNGPRDAANSPALNLTTNFLPGCTCTARDVVEQNEGNTAGDLDESVRVSGRSPSISSIECSESGDHAAQSTRTPSTPRTPVENIIGFTSSTTPRWSPVLATPQKSARRLAAKMTSPYLRRGVASCPDVSLESQERGGAVSHILHADYLSPNRNPCSFYRNYTDEERLVYPPHVEEEGSSPRHWDVVLRRADACVTVHEQKILGTHVASPKLSSSSSPLPFAKKRGAVLHSFLSQNTHDFDSFSFVPVAPMCARSNTACKEARNDKPCLLSSSCDDRHVCDSGDTLRDLSASSNQNFREGSGGEVGCDLLQPHPKDGVLLLETPPVDAVGAETRADVCFSVRRSVSAFEHLKGETPTRSFFSALSDSKSVNSECGTHYHCLNFSILPTHGSSGPLQAPNSASRFFDQKGLCNSSSIQQRGCADGFVPLYSEAENEGEEETKEEEEEEECNRDECEPGDRFRCHHRYKFLLYLPWRNENDFVPIHLDRNGVVWLAIHRVDGLPYAVKEVSQSHKETLKTELECLTLGNAPVTALQEQAANYITRYYTVSPYSTVSCDSPDSMAFLLQTEYFPMGNVMEWALDPQGLRSKEYSVPRESFWICVLQHGLLALESLHAAKIVHGNPLPFNVFIYNLRHYKLGNFGSAVKSPSVYPLDAPSVFLPQDVEGDLAWTPYETDVAVFAAGMLRLLGCCIHKRQSGTPMDNSFASDNSQTVCDLFMTEAERFGFKSFQETREDGHHDISDSLWHVLQAALAKKSIRVLLEMLNSPSPLLWAAQRLFDTEELYLLRRKHQLQLELEASCREETQEVNAPVSASRNGVGVDDHHIALVRWNCRGGRKCRRLGLCPGHNAAPSLSPSSFFFPFLPPLALKSPGVALDKLPSCTGGRSVAFRTPACSAFANDVDTSTRCKGPRRLYARREGNEAASLGVCDAFMHSSLRATEGPNMSRKRTRVSQRFCGAGVDKISFSDSVRLAPLSNATSCDGTCIDDADRPRLEANLLWSVRQIMAVMGWDCALTGAATCGDRNTSFHDSSFSLLRHAVRPLTSWE